VRAGEVGGREASLAWHVVPSAWVSDRDVGASVGGIDVEWSWGDVVALYAASAEQEQPAGRPAGQAS